MSIAVGERLPAATLKTVEDGKPRDITTDEVFGGKRVVLFAVPGAFTPTCSERHLPGYVDQFQAFRDKGVEVACIAVNDAFVMQAWGESQQVPAGLRMLADGNDEFTRALGLQLDASGFGMGTRSKRYALLAEDGIVKRLEVEAPGEFRVSSAEHMLQQV